MLQALGSDERKARRLQRKIEYAEYLQSEAWKEIRAQVLIRENLVCQGCNGIATVVHHIRYPKVLGQEKLSWLYALCDVCHDEIHRLARTMALRKATLLVVSKAAPNPDRIELHAGREFRVTVLPPDPQLSKRASKERQIRVPFESPEPRNLHLPGRRRRMKALKGMALAAENERLHKVQAHARERRADQRYERIDLSDLPKGAR